MPADFASKLRDRAYAARQVAGVVRRPPQSAADRARLDTAFAAVEAFARRLLPGYMLADYGRSWQSDTELLEHLRQLEPQSRSFDRKMALMQLLKLIEGVPGDTAEIGVFRGASSVLICEGTGAQAAPTGRSTHTRGCRRRMSATVATGRREICPPARPRFGIG